MASGLPFALAVGSLTFLLGVIWGGPFVEILKRLKIGKQVRSELPGHQWKTGTPTMGGILIIIPTLAIALALNLVNVIRTVTGASILLPLILMIGYAILGALDDWAGIRRSAGMLRQGEGLTPRQKMIGQIIIAAVVAVFFSLYEGGFQFANVIVLPLINAVFPISPILFIPIVIFIIVAMSNAVNFTDGLDGLAGIITATAFLAYGIVAYLQGQIFLVQLCFIVVGACFAFLWFNAHPAQLFMGDVGSMALGSMLALVAIMTGQWLLLPIIAIIPVTEMVSVVLQVSYFKATKGKRLFRITPIHHHFEQVGWSETQIVQRFWLVGLLAAMFGVALALL